MFTAEILKTERRYSMLFDSYLYIGLQKSTCRPTNDMGRD